MDGELLLVAVTDLGAVREDHAANDLAVEAALHGGLLIHAEIGLRGASDLAHLAGAVERPMRTHRADTHRVRAEATAAGAGALQAEAQHALRVPRHRAGHVAHLIRGV